LGNVEDSGILAARAHSRRSRITTSHITRESARKHERECAQARERVRASERESARKHERECAQARGPETIRVVKRVYSNTKNVSV
jgi:hypothetical protein